MNLLILRAASFSSGRRRRPALTLRSASIAPQPTPFPSKKGDKVEGRFRSLYISNAAQAGLTLDILITEDKEAFSYELAVEISTISLIDTITTVVNDVKTDAQKLANAYDQRGSDSAAITAAAVNTIYVTTGDLPAGLYEIEIRRRSANLTHHEVQFRDSANVVKDKIRLDSAGIVDKPFILDFALNDDFIITNTVVQPGGDESEFWITWRRRKA